MSTAHAMEKKQVTVELLKTFSPLDGLKTENLQALTGKTSVQETTGGRFLFKEGDTEKRTIYLLSGAVELRSDRIQRHDDAHASPKHERPDGIPHANRCQIERSDRAGHRKIDKGIKPDQQIVNDQRQTERKQQVWQIHETITGFESSEKLLVASDDESTIEILPPGQDQDRSNPTTRIIEQVEDEDEDEFELDDELDY